MQRLAEIKGCVSVGNLYSSFDRLLVERTIGGISMDMKRV